MYFECRALRYLASDLLDEGLVLEQGLLDLLHGWGKYLVAAWKHWAIAFRGCLSFDG
jgi:hypothetical protein